MKPPPPLHLALRRSRLARGDDRGVVRRHGGAAARAPVAGRCPSRRCRRHRRAPARGRSGAAVGRSAPVLLRVGVDRRIAVITADGRACDGDILADSYVGHRLTTIVWLPDGARRARTLMVAADTFAADDFRRLRVALRYGRAAGAGPENQRCRCRLTAKPRRSVDQHPAFCLRLCAEQMQVKRYERLGIGERSRALRPDASGRATAS